MKTFTQKFSMIILAITMVTLDTRLGCLDGDLLPGSDGQLMIDSVEQAFKLMFKLDFQPSMWKIYSTKDWKAFVEAMDNITRYVRPVLSARLT